MHASQLPKLKGASTNGTDVRIILQQRDLCLLHALSTLRLLDREQVRAISGFNSLTRVNTRLQKLTEAGLLKRFFFVSALGGKKAVYSLSKKGAQLIRVVPNGINRPRNSFLIGDRFVAHQLAINQVYCAACLSTHIEDARVQNWRSFAGPLSTAIPLAPDAYFEIRLDQSTRPMFLEVDRGTESLSVWTEKTKRYLNLAASGEFERLFQQPRFAVLIVAESERRMQSLRAHISTMTSKIFYLSTLGEITTHGFWEPIWFRPEGEQTQSLI